MNTKVLLPLLTITLALAGGVATYAMFNEARANEGGPAPAAAGASATDPAMETASRVNVKLLESKLEFLGHKPALTGRPLLIEFWATWCPPCRASIAHLNELNAKYHGRGLEIVGITSEDKGVVERFRARTAMDYSVALDKDQELANEFQVETIPHAWLLDKDGRVVWSGHPMELDEQAIVHLLATHTAS